MAQDWAIYRDENHALVLSISGVFDDGSKILFVEIGESHGNVKSMILPLDDFRSMLVTLGMLPPQSEPYSPPSTPTTLPAWPCMDALIRAMHDAADALAAHTAPRHVRSAEPWET